MFTFDNTIHIGELLVLGGAAWAILKGGLGLRDAVISMTGQVASLQTGQHDHEARIRSIEWERTHPGKSDRRDYRDRRMEQA